MRSKKALVLGSIGAAVSLPMALQLMMPTAASAVTGWSPVVTAASPNSGPTSGGTTVIITGNRLTLVTAVLFGNVKASYTIVSSGEIIATSPAEPAGTVVVRAEDGTILGPTTAYFTYS